MVGLWSGFFVPTGTPKPIIDKLAQGIARGHPNTDVSAKLSGMAVNPAGSGPAEEFRKLIAEEIKMWADVVKAAI